ncbi:MAG: hypothetical protein NC253_02365 [Ruminococcus sp.]|nr:hypothetical protein [Ruminococcus sp.]MCM1382619.1 hypothetical protein [Muribaculaceae bacterium]MCM1480689.1 hypothetical protein [Muribaculaceae bacterium]
MVWSAVIAETIIFIALFSAAVIFSAMKNPEAGAHNYPPEIREEYFKKQGRTETAPLGKKAVAQKIATVIVFAAILTAGAIIAGAESFLDGFVFGFLLLAAEGVWDTFFIDWVLFAKWKIFRLPGTEHMDKEYGQKRFHVKGMIFPGLLYAAAVGALTGLGTILIK